MASRGVVIAERRSVEADRARTSIATSPKIARADVSMAGAPQADEAEDLARCATVKETGPTSPERRSSTASRLCFGAGLRA